MSPQGRPKGESPSADHEDGPPYVSHDLFPSTAAGLRWRTLRGPDAVALGALFDSLSPADRRHRFHGAVNCMPINWLRSMADVDQFSHVAFGVATADGNAGALIAEARWSIDGSGVAAEFAMAVAPGWRRRGVGQRCLQVLAGIASQRGLARLHGSVQADNTAMLALARRCSFSCTPDRSDASLVNCEVRLAIPRQCAVAKPLYMA